MNYSENDTMKMIGSQSIGILSTEAKTRIYDVSKVYADRYDINLAELLRFGTDVFLLGFSFAKGDY